MAKVKKTFSVGDRVAYSAVWLKSTGQYSGLYASLRGTVRAVEPLGAVQLVTIKWDGHDVASHYHDDGLGRVIAPNLTLVSRIAVDAALAG